MQQATYTTKPQATLSRWAAACTLALASVAATGMAYAQQSPAPASEQAAAQHHPMDKRGWKNPEQHQAMRLDRMKSLLQIQPEQEKNWQAYTQALQSIEKPQHQRPAADANTLTRLDWQKQQRQAHTAAAEKRDAATRQLYNSLNANQQKAMDQLHTGHGRKGKARHHRGQAHPGFAS